MKKDDKNLRELTISGKASSADLWAIRILSSTNRSMYEPAA